MAVFSIQRDSTVVVDGINRGREVDAMEFRSPVGKIVTGLASQFGDAVSDVRSNAADITGQAAKHVIKPKEYTA